MFRRKLAGTPTVEEKKEKPTPTYLQNDYPYQAVGASITDLDVLDPGAAYEIMCPACKMCIRALGQKVSATYKKLGGRGCLNCGNQNLTIRAVDMSKEKE